MVLDGGSGDAAIGDDLEVVDSAAPGKGVMVEDADGSGDKYEIRVKTGPSKQRDRSNS